MFFLNTGKGISLVPHGEVASFADHGEVAPTIFFLGCFHFVLLF